MERQRERERKREREREGGREGRRERELVEYHGLQNMLMNIINCLPRAGFCTHKLV